MPHPVALPVIGGLSLFAAATGVWLGKSAVAEINPAYFSEREARFHGDLAPNRGTDWGQVQTAELQQASLATDYGTFCLRCIDYPEDVHPVRFHEPEGVPDGWAASAPDEGVFEASAVAETFRNPEWEKVERYAAAPVTSQPARQEIAPAEAEAAEAPAPGEPAPEDEPVEG